VSLEAAIWLCTGKFEVTYLKGKLEEHHRDVSRVAPEIGRYRHGSWEEPRKVGILRPEK
jgi:hypothetical protein